jgi:hypothetical protein
MQQICLNMKKIFNLEQKFFNGTVLTKTINYGFTTEELALKTKEYLDNLNQLYNDSPLISVTSVSEYIIFENEDEVPILKENE